MSDHHDHDHHDDHPEHTWQIEGFDAIFTVADAQRAKAHYERLGFTTSEHDEHYAFAERGRLIVHLDEPDAGVVVGGGCLYIHVDDADVVAGEWRSAGLEVAGPEDFDYGKREGFHTDPDGNRVRFGSPLRRHSR